MLFCGIDVAKRKHVALCLDDAGQVVKPAFSVANDRTGFEHLLQQLAALPGPVTVGLEATGHYWLALYETLTTHGYDVIVLNPLQVHAYRRSGVRKRKTDASDAFWIADFIRIGNVPASERHTPVMLQLRELTRFRHRLSETIGDCKRKVLTVLDRVFPEYETLFSNVFLKSSRRVLAEAVTAQEFADFNLEELTHLLRTASRGHFGQAKAVALQQMARQSIGVGFLTNAVHLEVQCLLEQMTLLETQRQQVDETIATLLVRIPQYLTTIPGIGPVTGAAILAEIGDVQRFGSVEKLVAYAGIDATVYQTGQFTAERAHMSKRGSPYLRHALWQAANVAFHKDTELRAFYQRKRAEGKAHGTTLGAVCRKLLARIYVILKEERPYVIR